jgi:hypothetical protein
VITYCGMRRHVLAKHGVKRACCACAELASVPSCRAVSAGFPTVAPIPFLPSIYRFDPLTLQNKSIGLRVACQLFGRRE